MSQKQNPTWWTSQYDSSWDRVKAAFQRDWDQTKHDFGGKQPDTDQDVNDTVKQAAGKQPIPPRGVPAFETTEPAYKFGYGARQYYGTRYAAWDDKLESQLRDDWAATRQGTDDWDTYRTAVRKGWDYDNSSK